MTTSGQCDITYKNLGKVNLWGVEFSGEWRFYDKWSVTVHRELCRGHAAGRRPGAPHHAKFDGSDADHRR